MSGLTIMGVTLLGTTVAYAQESGSNGNPSIIQKIAQKFGLNEADVKSVFDQNRADKKAQMETKFEARLDQLVKDGKITDAQKQLIIAKRKEISGQTQTGRKGLTDWATINGIDLKYLMGGMGMRGGFGRGMGK